MGSGLVSLVQAFCSSIGGILGQLPFIGDTLGGLVDQVCAQIVAFLNTLTGGGGAG